MSRDGNLNITKQPLQYISHYNTTFLLYGHALMSTSFTLTKVTAGWIVSMVMSVILFRHVFFLLFSTSSLLFISFRSFLIDTYPPFVTPCCTLALWWLVQFLVWCFAMPCKAANICCELDKRTQDNMRKRFRRAVLVWFPLYNANVSVVCVSLAVTVFSPQHYHSIV